MLSRFIVLSCLLFSAGCLWPVRRETDRTIADLSARPYDVAPPLPAESLKPPAQRQPGKDGGGPGRETKAPAQTDIETTALMMQDAKEPAPTEKKKKGELEIPSRIPGAETPHVVLPREDKEIEKEIERLYPPLPALPAEVTPLPGPDGRPYTLADFQRLAAENSPTLRQAASDVQAARGALVQARTYPNPTVAIMTQPTNNNSIAGAHGGTVDQPIITGGKMGLAVATAQKNLENADLALRRARSDLATAVRNAYYAFLVARETMVVNKALAEFTDKVYTMQKDLRSGALAALHELASLRAMAYTARLNYKTSISSYLYAWKQLVATAGLRQLPLSEVAGHVDRLIPYFDYDSVLQYALLNHTDVLTARNGVEIGKYNLKLAQVTPLFPNVDVNVGFFKDTTLAPFGLYHTVSLSAPIPIWDLNKGNIISAQAAYVRAAEENHRVEVTMTNNLAAAYANYKNNLDSLEYYRKYILPDQVRYYRGVYNRRQVDINSPFGDLVNAQQTLAANVTTYLGILGSLWSSAITVADFLQTDDLFQKSRPLELPGLPSLEQFPQWPCPHPGLGMGPMMPGGGCMPMQPAGAPPIVKPVPRAPENLPPGDAQLVPPAPPRGLAPLPAGTTTSLPVSAPSPSARPVAATEAAEGSTDSPSALPARSWRRRDPPVSTVGPDDPQ